MARKGTVQFYKRYSGVDDRIYWYADYVHDSFGSRVTRRLGDTLTIKGTEKQLRYLADKMYKSEDVGYTPIAYDIE